VIAAAITWPKLRQFGSLHDAQPIEHPEGPAAEVIAKPAGPVSSSGL